MIIRTDGFRDKTECIETNTKEKQADNCSKSDSLSSELHVMSVHNKLSANSIRTVSVDVKHHVYLLSTQTDFLLGCTRSL